MRISGGDARGIKLKVPPGVRPASEKVRQAIFSSLAAVVPGARVLDLYCGSGAYGLEALSRGADSAVFVDHSREATAACRANLDSAGLTASATVRRIPADRYLRRQAAADRPFDLVFVDPPYADEALGRILDNLRDLITPQGRVVLETRWTPEDPPEAAGFIMEADRRYGDTRVLTFRYVGDE